MPLWLVLTLSAAFMQNIRSSVQKHLKGRVGTSGATLVRFLFGWPFALFYLFVIVRNLNEPLPSPGWAFLGWTVLGSFSQIGAQALLIFLFALRNFAAGSAYARVEPVAAAMLAPALLGEAIGAGAWIGIAVSVVGVLLVSSAGSLAPGDLLRQLGSKAARIGLFCALLFGLASVSYRGAALSLGAPETGLDGRARGAMVNSCAIILQTILMAVWVTWREPEQWRAIGRAWRPSLLVGFVGATASLGWFSAFALQDAATVKAVAQVEIVFAILTSLVVFRERVTRTEMAGAGFVASGVILLLAV